MDSTSTSTSTSLVTFLLQEAGYFVMLIMMGFLGMRIGAAMLKKPSKPEASKLSEENMLSNDGETPVPVTQKENRHVPPWRAERKEKAKSNPELITSPSSWAEQQKRQSEPQLITSPSSWAEQQKKQSEPELIISPSSWAEQQKRRREQAASAKKSGPTEEEITRRMKSVLNKLTLEKFDDLYKQLLNCGISTEAHVRILITEVFDKATTQHHFIEMYTTLCVSLSEWFSANVKVGNFKRILLDQCQASFEANLQPPKELAGKLQKGSAPEGEAEQEIWFKYKMRMLGNIKLVGELIARRMVASKVLIACSQELLAEPSPCTLESLAQLLTVTGKEFDVPTWTHHAALCAIFDKLRALTKDKSVPARTRFLLQDVIDLRENGWVDQKVATTKLERPKKLEDIHAQDSDQ